MRILGVHSIGEVRGGGDGVYLYGNRLLHQRGHALAWMHAGPSAIAESLGTPIFGLPAIAWTSPMQRHADIVKGLIYSRQAVKLAQEAVDAFRPDVVHIHNIRGVFSPAILPVFQRCGIPVVQTLHDYMLVCPVNSFLSHGRVCEACKGRRYYHCGLQRCARSGTLASLVLGLSGYVADYGYHYDTLIRRYIAPGEFMRQKMIEFGYEPGKIITLNNAYFAPGELAPAGQPRIGVLFAGRLAYEKGVDLLIRAAAGLYAPVWIAGDGPARPELEALARQVGADQIAFLGFQPLAALQTLYAQAQVVVLPSRWYENGPLVILEAYANGTPVVGANIGAIPEFIEEGKTGYLFEANNPDSLRLVLQGGLADPQGLRRMGESARRLVRERYSPDIYVQKLEKILESVL